MSRPKINWFSPIPPARSGIASIYTGPMVESLAKYCDLTLWTDQAKWDPALERFAPVRRFRSDDVQVADFAPDSINVYQIGNNREFHASIYGVARRFPGVVVVHDPNLFEFFVSLCWRDKVHVADFCDMMETAHGLLGRTAAEGFCGGTFRTRELLSLFPMTETALTAAYGVVTHNRQVFRELSARNRWPVQYLPLSHPQGPVGEKNAPVQDGKLKLIVFGHISPNRRVAELLKAIAIFPRRELIQLDVYGQIWPGNNIAELVTRYGLGGQVRMHGYTPDDELDAALASADLAINLRYPTVGEASATQLRIWQHAVPSVSTPVGWYAEQPEGTMEFVRPGFEVVDLKMHFDQFLADPGSYRRLGEKGREVFVREHSPEVYAKRVVEFCEVARRYRRRSCLLRAVHDVLPKVAALRPAKR